MSFFTSIDRKDFYKALFIASVVPNLIIVIVCLVKDPNIARPFINLDYLLIVLLFSFTNKYLKIIGILLFTAFFTLDALLIALQSLPHNMKFNDLLYLLTSLFDGPQQYRYIVLGVLALLFIQLSLLLFFSPKATTNAYVVIGILLIILKAGQLAINLPINIVNSQLIFFLQNFSQFKASPEEMLLLPSQEENASKPWFEAIQQNKELPHKLLLIVNESWGVAKNSEAQYDVLKVLEANKDSFEFFNQGISNIESITVYAEFRELCHSTTPNMFYIKRTRMESGYARCLPNILKQNGYKTVALHGNSKVIYEREFWHPLAGFQESYFGKDIDLPKDSYGGMGIFDPNLLPFIANKFENNNKLFFYWLTLTSHYPYAIEDIRNRRFDCKQYGITATHACHSLMMQAQFFDALNELVHNPAMAGVDVIVVGDHPTSFVINEKENYKYIYDNKVPWVHFKIKDNITSSYELNDISHLQKSSFESR